MLFGVKVGRESTHSRRLVASKYQNFGNKMSYALLVYWLFLWAHHMWFSHYLEGYFLWLSNHIIPLAPLSFLKQNILEWRKLVHHAFMISTSMHHILVCFVPFFAISCYKVHYEGLKSKIFVDFYFSAVDFFNQVNLLYGTLTEFCTPENCPTMSAGPKYVAAWLISLIYFFCKYTWYKCSHVRS